MIRTLLAVAALTAMPLLALAATTTFRVWGSPILYLVPQEKYGEPFVGKLESGELVVHVLTYSSSSSYADPASGKIIVEGNNVTLCYKEKTVVHKPNQPLAALIYAVALEYTIAGLPDQKYSFRVSRQCK